MPLNLRRLTNLQQTGKEGNSDLPEVSYNNIDRWQYYFCQLLNIMDFTVLGRLKNIQLSHQNHRIILVRMTR
jgi:hypothetical protein